MRIIVFTAFHRRTSHLIAVNCGNPAAYTRLTMGSLLPRLTETLPARAQPPEKGQAFEWCDEVKGLRRPADAKRPHLNVVQVNNYEGQAPPDAWALRHLAFRGQLRMRQVPATSHGQPECRPSRRRPANYNRPEARSSATGAHAQRHLGRHGACRLSQAAPHRDASGRRP